MSRMLLLALSLAVFISPAVLAEEVRLRNMAVIKVGHKHYLQGTAVNASGRDLQAVTIRFDILGAGRMIGTREAEARSIGAGEAWRIWLPIETEGADGFRVSSIVTENNPVHATGVAVQ